MNDELVRPVVVITADRVTDGVIPGSQTDRIKVGRQGELIYNLKTRSRHIWISPRFEFRFTWVFRPVAHCILEEEKKKKHENV